MKLYFRYSIPYIPQDYHPVANTPQPPVYYKLAVTYAPVEMHHYTEPTTARPINRPTIDIRDSLSSNSFECGVRKGVSSFVSFVFNGETGKIIVKKCLFLSLKNLF